MSGQYFGLEPEKHLALTGPTLPHHYQAWYWDSLQNKNLLDLSGLTHHYPWSQSLAHPHLESHYPQNHPHQDQCILGGMYQAHLHQYHPFRLTSLHHYQSHQTDSRQPFHLHRYQSHRLDFLVTLKKPNQNTQVQSPHWQRSSHHDPTGKQYHCQHQNKHHHLRNRRWYFQYQRHHTYQKQHCPMFYHLRSQSNRW